MKKTHILFAALVSSLAFMGCGFENLQTPKEVKVRTDATYEFSVMNFDSEKEGSKLKVSNYFDLGKTLEEKTGSEDENSKLKVYKYNDGSQFQQFLIHMPLDEIDFDFSESFKDMDFSKDMENFNVSRNFTIPSITTPEKEEPINLDDVHVQLNKGVKFGGDSTGPDLPITFGTVPGKLEFSSITYSSGYLVVSGALGDTITGSVELKDGSTTLGFASFVNGEAKINLANKTIKKEEMIISFSDTGKKFQAQVQEDSKIKTAAGVVLTDTYAPEITYSNISFPFSLPSNIKACSITNGKLEVQIKRTDEWKGVIPSYSINLSGGISESFNQSTTSKTYTDSNKLELRDGDIIAAPNLTITINGATMDFEHGPSVYAKVTISEISATVKLDDNYETSIDNERDVPEDITNYINKIVWNPSGFDVKAVNDLPEGNDITLTFNSDFLKMTNVSKVIEAKGDSAPETTYSFRGLETTTWFINVPDGETGTKYTKIPLKGEIELPDYDDAGGEKTFTVTKVSPGKEYHLNLTVEPVFDWKEAIVKLPEEKTKFNDKMNTGLNKKTLFSVLGDNFAEKIKISKVPLYLFANIPDNMRNGMKFKGKIKAYYGKEDKTEVDHPVSIDILPENTTINTNNAMPLFKTNDAGEITNNFGDTALDFAPALNLYSNEGSLCLDYDIKLDGDQSGGMRITSAEIEELKAQGKSAVKVDIVLIFSMDFTVTDTISIDMMDIAKKKDSDLLGRSEATDISSYEDYIKVVKSASVIIEDFKLPMSGDVALKIDMYKNGDAETKEIGNGKNMSLEINPYDLLKQYPLTPDIQFVIGKQGATSNFGLLRTMPISGKIKLKVKAKGDIPIKAFSEKE